MMMPRRLALAAVLLAGFGRPASPADPPKDGDYRILKRVKVGGEGGWDFLAVDPEGKRLYLSHSTQTDVVDLDKDAVVGKVANTAGVHGIAVARDLGRGFTSNGRADAVTVFDLKTLEPLGTVPVGGKNPDAIVYEPRTHRVLTFNGTSHDASVIDAREMKLVGTVPLDGKPEVAVVTGEGRVFVNIEDKALVAELDPAAPKLVRTWSIAPCEEPSGLALDSATNRLFSVCGNALMAFSDAKAGKLITTVPIGKGADGVAFDPDAKLAFSTNGEGTITVVHEDSPDKISVVQTLPTQRGARTIALDPRTHRVYTVTAEYGPPPSPTAERPRPRPSIVPDTLTVLVIGR
ncbi:MAG TPA: YncE family protein [Vicinamibacteria bacterium]|jgi:DNA-binding beta-propeller fold protein YncE